MYWRPDPIGPPAKKRNGRIICGSTPPDFSSTSPVRSRTTRRRARRGALRLRFPLDAEVREEVVAGRGVLGQRLAAAIAVVADGAAADEGRRRRRPPRRGPLTSDRVARIRLSRSACLRAAVQRPPAIDSPARLTTRRGAVELARQAPRMSVGRPADTGDAGFAGARTRAAPARREATGSARGRRGSPRPTPTRGRCRGTRCRRR